MGATKTLIRTFKEVREKRTYHQRIRQFEGFVQVDVESDELRLKTARSPHDLLEVLKLRHEVFVQEWQGRRTYHRLDVDEYDFLADHLMIINKSTDEVVGTYRLLSSHFTLDFYSSQEFQLDAFLRLPAAKLEMGRACIKPEFRGGKTLDLLWRGLGLYAHNTSTRYMFGCSSLREINALQYGQLLSHFRENDQWSDKFQIRPTSKYVWPTFRLPESALPMSPKERREMVPTLLRSYFNAGAKVYGHPALDRDFSCIDVLTILDWDDLNPKFRSRYV